MWIRWLCSYTNCEQNDKGMWDSRWPQPFLLYQISKMPFQQSLTPGWVCGPQSSFATDQPPATTGWSAFDVASLHAPSFRDYLQPLPSIADCFRDLDECVYKSVFRSCKSDLWYFLYYYSYEDMIKDLLFASVISIITGRPLPKAQYYHHHDHHSICLLLGP
jgi:hypothetical protein